MSRAAILVLGMHRSGTSALTWLLGRMGAALPTDAIAAHADNAQGYFESAGLVAADEQLLRAARSSWFDARPLDLSRLPAPAIRARKDRIREAITDGWSDAPLLAIKDPRQCRFVGVVRDALGEMGIASRAVLMLRAPAEIARSLARRDGTSTGFAHLLWLRHMIDAERATRAMPRAIVSFDALMADWRSVAAALSSLTHTSVDALDADEIARFLDPALRHHGRTPPAPLDEPLAGIVAEVAAALDAAAARDDAEARARLDAAYGALDAAPWLEGDMAHDELRHRRIPDPEIETAPPVPQAASIAERTPMPEPLPDPSGDAALIRDSGLLDADWYAATYPDTAATGLDPVDHYIRIGAALGYRPNPLFDTAYYARQMMRRDAAALRDERPRG